MSSTFSYELKSGLHRVIAAAAHAVDGRPALETSAVSKLGLARRFECMLEIDLLMSLRHADRDVACLVYDGLRDVLLNDCDRMRSLTAELAGYAPTLGRITAAALRAKEHYDREQYRPQWQHASRIQQYLDDSTV